MNEHDTVFVGRPHRHIAKGTVLDVNQTRARIELEEQYGSYAPGIILEIHKTLCYEERPDEKTYEDLVNEANETMQSRCSLDDPPHWITHAEHYLTGQSLNKSGRERDQQRRKVYQAEREVDSGTYTLDDIDEVRAYVRGLSEYPWFQNRFGVVDVSIRECQSNARRSHTSEYEMAFANFDLWAVLHEVMHTRVPPPHPAHGPLFATMFAVLIDHILSIDITEAYDEHGVDYQREAV